MVALIPRVVKTTKNSLLYECEFTGLRNIGASSYKAKRADNKCLPHITC